ncbi:hypothetical protein, partial [Phycicoccus flavus]|nr:hypothetical protein [Phycicoccus flavus]
MSLSDCLLDLLLVAVVVRQVRGRPLTTRTLVLPLVIVGVAAGEYLRSVPTAGNDPWLVAGGVVGGVLLGTACAALT